MAAKRIHTKAIFRTPAAMADEAAGILMAGGAIGCSVAGMAAPGARPKPTVALEAWFDRVSAAKLARLRRTLGNAGMLAAGARGVRVRRVADPGWATKWMKQFRPFRVGRRFLIVPPWKRVSEPGRLSIAIQPGQAFGTGHHPTTAGMLRAIERLMRTRTPRAALDVGTGSGVLAIAMALMGARDIMAIDVDPIALENARANARLSRADRSIRFSAVPIESIRRRFDLVAANIFAETLIDYAPRLRRIVAPGGRLVLGGILRGEADSVRRHFRPAFRCTACKTNRGWTTLVFAR